MGQFSVEKPGLPGSVLSGNQQTEIASVSIAVMAISLAPPPLMATYTLGAALDDSLLDAARSDTVISAIANAA
jgi:hypothetical protein